ncbi:hypothetical protein BRPE64_CCDS05210 [Caballeronia insecticola]|uniref:Uncharacterized protein n=1 Tax=Caballeronia insecticola TaxID=758793 RepID=R4WPU8_9BURK|nr:hypothetical protein BRPE64_CCDS05210 [Caballeronia insecticola]
MKYPSKPVNGLALIASESGKIDIGHMTRSVFARETVRSSEKQQEATKSSDETDRAACVAARNATRRRGNHSHGCRVRRVIQTVKAMP